MAASLEKIGAMYQEQLETGIKERLKGTTPKGLGGAASLTDGMISAEIFRQRAGVHFNFSLDNVRDDISTNRPTRKGMAAQLPRADR